MAAVLTCIVLTMILFLLEEIQDVLSLHICTNLNAGGICIQSYVKGRKVNTQSWSCKGV